MDGCFLEYLILIGRHELARLSFIQTQLAPSCVSACVSTGEKITSEHWSIHWGVRLVAV